MRIQLSIVDKEPAAGDDVSVVISVPASEQNAEAFDAETVARIVRALTTGQERKYLERLVVKDGSRILLVRTCDVDWIEAQGNYVLLHVGKSVHMVRETIGSLESELDPERFQRIHRSTIVNIDRIKELRPQAHGDYRVLLEGGAQLTLSRGYRGALGSLLKS